MTVSPAPRAPSAIPPGSRAPRRWPPGPGSTGPPPARSPVSPKASIMTKPEASTPTAAPRLFVKYSMASDPPGVPGNRRINPALISGKVMPSSTDCGRIRTPASVHLNNTAEVPPPRRGGSACARLRSRRRRRDGTRTRRARSAASVIAYPRSRFFQRTVRRLHSQEPIAMPPMNSASTSVCA